MYILLHFTLVSKQLDLYVWPKSVDVKDLNKEMYGEKNRNQQAMILNSFKNHPELGVLEHVCNSSIPKARLSQED